MNDKLKMAVMRATVDGVDRIIIQPVEVFGHQWVRARESILRSTAERIQDNNITWLGWFDEVENPPSILELKTN